MIPILRIVHEHFEPVDEQSRDYVLDCQVEGAEVPTLRFRYNVLASCTDEARMQQQIRDQVIANAHMAYKQDYGLECAVCF